MLKIVGYDYVRSERKEAWLSQRDVNSVIKKRLSEGYEIVNKSETRVIFGKPSKALITLEDERKNRRTVDFHGKIKAFYGNKILKYETFKKFLREYFNGEIEILQYQNGDYYIHRVEKKVGKKNR